MSVSDCRLLGEHSHLAYSSAAGEYASGCFRGGLIQVTAASHESSEAALHNSD